MPVPRSIYIGHPASAYEGDPASLVRACGAQPALHNDWVIRERPYDSKASLHVRDFCSMVLQSPGPVLLLEPVRRNVLEDIRSRIGSRVPVVACSVSDLAGLRQKIIELGSLFDSGEPSLPLDCVVAILMMRKFDQEHMWSGNSKGYMWFDWIHRGRGLDEKFHPRVAHVLNVLLQHGIVVMKNSCSKKKYALNPARRSEIYGYLRSRRLPEEVEKILSRNGAVESARSLDVVAEYEEPEG